MDQFVQDAGAHVVPHAEYPLRPPQRDTQPVHFAEFATDPAPHGLPRHIVASQRFPTPRGQFPIQQPTSVGLTRCLSEREESRRPYA
jgi:hypothetical protein